ncbi:MAG: hypothetical protein KME32_22680 [Mojavia pulchra JT2-VF2]|jgi:hypothetical protein|uniref:Uncharacterized protein n=1 Tax=Mojavia pulchra JT2-VF2 TaxID=287848 RepID=A0A951Q2V6_9NOST|nr:hypothetical protein [Mojavia pulchra JT2-VF2]
MFKDFKHFLYYQNLKPICNFSTQLTSIYLKILFLSIIPLSFLFNGCSNKDENQVMEKKISKLEKEAESRLTYKIQEQERYFSKHKTFFKSPDEPATSYGSSPPIFGIQKCYRYYTETNSDLTSKTTIDAVYSYAVQDDCGGMWGLELRWYAGAVFAVPLTRGKELKTISVVCRNIESYGRIPSRPEYINGVVKCPSNTTKVY